MRKLDLILENIRDEYMINLLEEGEVTELETLKTKKFLNENLNRIRGMLVEEGALDSVKQHLGNNWGKYLAGAGTAAGAYGLADTDFGDEVARSFDSASKELPYNTVSNVGSNLASNLGNDISGGIDDAKTAVSGAYDTVANKAGEAYDTVANKAGELYGQAADKAGELYGQAGDVANDAANQVQATATGAVSNDPRQLYAMLEDPSIDDDAKGQIKAMLAAQGAGGAAALGAAGYGAKKLADRLRK